MAAAELDAIEERTGYRPRSCPWRALDNPLVQRVLQLLQPLEHGILDWAYPDLSALEFQALMFYRRISERSQGAFLEGDRRKAERAREQQRQGFGLPVPQGRR